MSTRTTLLLLSLAAGAMGGLIAALGRSDGDDVLLVMGAVVVVLAAALAVATLRWLRPSTRLPEHLRPPPTPDWRRRVLSLEMRDGTRITCIVVRPGGFVVPRRTDPPFDARDAIAVVPATQDDFAAEAERQQAAR